MFQISITIYQQRFSNNGFGNVKPIPLNLELFIVMQQVGKMEKIGFQKFKKSSKRYRCYLVSFFSIKKEKLLQCVCV